MAQRSREVGKVKITPVQLAEPEKQQVPAKPKTRPNPPRIARTVPAPAPVRTGPPPKPAAPAPEPAALPAARPPNAVPLVAQAYPRAAANPVQSRPRRPQGPTKASPRSAPLWTPEATASPDASSSPEAPATPRAAATAPPPQPGEGDQAGIVVDPYPIGRVDLKTPGFMALSAADIVARFEIGADGAITSVTLDPGTGIAAVDAEVIEFLKTVRWSPKTVGGVAVAGVQELDFSKRAK